MAGLLPSSPDTSGVDDADPRVVGLDSDDADELLAALSSATARRILAALYDDPDTPASLAKRVDTSLQNTQYHLGKLEAARVVEVVDTVYSEKGREMSVYAPADRPLVVVASPEAEQSALRALLTRLLGGVGLLAVASALVQFVLDRGPKLATEQVAVSTVRARTAAPAAGVPPGLLVFAGGLVVLVGVALGWYVQRRWRGGRT